MVEGSPNSSSLAALEGLKPWRGHEHMANLNPPTSTDASSQGFITGWKFKAQIVQYNCRGIEIISQEDQWEILKFKLNVNMTLI